MLLLCTGGSSPSCLLLICIEESLSGMPQSLEICSSYALYSISLEKILCIRRILTHGCCGWYNDLYRDKSSVLGKINHHSLLPPSGRTFGSGSRNAFIHKSSIHWFFITTFISSAWLLLEGSDQVGSLVILDIMTGCSVFSFSLGIFMFFLVFFFSSWVHGAFL